MLQPPHKRHLDISGDMFTGASENKVNLIYDLIFMFTEASENRVNLMLSFAFFAGTCGSATAW